MSHSPPGPHGLLLVSSVFVFVLVLGREWKYKVKLSLRVTKEMVRHESVWGNGVIDPSTLELGNSEWQWVVSG
jgi:hypothetical protein